jgi:hypothetical protein
MPAPPVPELQVEITFLKEGNVLFVLSAHVVESDVLYGKFHISIVARIYVLVETGRVAEKR